ncbi:MAG: cation transporter [Anaerolineales bacterium]|nr:cation transporter [Anaerolineales bacterium]
MSTDHKHDDEHTHDHEVHEDHDHDHEHDHDHGGGLYGLLRTIFHQHDHSHDNSELVTDNAFMNTEEGIRTVWIALILLTATTLLQLIIVYFSGSVALLADTLHNLVDGANSIPLLIAFYLARRAANRRYNYGYGKAEDVAGIFIVLSIAVSAAVIFYESVTKFINPEPLQNLGWVAAAALIGAAGNEAVAFIQIRTGRKIGSAALVADGLHARTDGLTSLAVLPAVLGSWLGYPIIDPIVGILIGIAILFITRDAAVSMWYRLMDSIEPEILQQAEEIVRANPKVNELHRVRMRWIGSRLHAEVTIGVDGSLTTIESHDIAEAVRHDLFHKFDKLSEVVVHVEPFSKDIDHHQATSHHEPVPRPFES